MLLCIFVQGAGEYSYPILRLSLAEFLNVAENDLVGSLPTTIGQLSDLFLLDYTNNFLTGQLPTTIGMLSALTELLGGLNMQGGALPTELGQMVNLIGLDLDNNRFVGPIPTTIGNLLILGTVNSLSLSFYGASDSHLFLLCFQIR